jgi:D-alanyl-D-alanine carboxypeptidase/D-alanyl-D-alanine-endopeptidase (penicillin-binding protein 4)
VLAEPPLAGVAIDTTVPINDGPCGDWRGGLQADFSDPARLPFLGSFAAACAERSWSVAYADPKSYDERLLAGLWQQLGGKLGGVVREGMAPGNRPSFESVSPALSEVVREINKFSNNVMAQQLFLTLGLARGGVGSPDSAREALRVWMSERLGKPPFGTWIDNGSGLSRDTRLNAGLLARLLQTAWAGPVMPELMASLPVSGLDGTMLRSRAGVGRAHLKTGSLRDVAAIAGYVLPASGRRLVVVAIINHPNANAARPALDALVQWVAAEGWAASPASSQ